MEVVNRFVVARTGEGGGSREGGRHAIKGQHRDPCDDRTVLYLTAVVETKTVHVIQLN